VLEFHAVFDKRMFGPDASASLTIEEVKSLVKGVREIHKSRMFAVDKSDTSKYDDMKDIFGKSLAASRDLKKGDIITADVLEAKKPKHFGIDAREHRRIIGKRLKRDLQKWEFISESDIYEET